MRRAAGQYPWRVWAGMMALALVAGCAAAPASRERAVESRAQARWDALIAGDLVKAYEFLSPGSREVYTRENYMASVRAGMWKKARVDRVECAEPDLCDVVMQIDYVYRGSPISTPLRETWSRSGDEWWFVLK